MNNSGFLRYLRALDEDAKRLWTFALTTVTMIVIVTVWLTWFNNLTPREVTADVSAAAGDSGFSAWESVKSGVRAVGNGMINGVQGFGNMFQAPREYIVKPPQ